MGKVHFRPAPTLFNFHQNYNPSNGFELTSQNIYETTVDSGMEARICK